MQQGQGGDKKPGLSWSTPAQSTSPAAVNNNIKQNKMLPPATPAGTHVGAYVGILVGGIIVGVLLSWGYSAWSNRGTTTTSATSTSASTKAANGTTSTKTGSVASGVSITGSGASSAALPLDIPSPQKAGLSVKVSKASVSKPTWVVVYDNNAGKPGNVLGAHLFFETGAGTVTLLRATRAGVVYFVGTSADNGDRRFAKATDKATLAADGTIETVQFAAN